MKGKDEVKRHGAKTTTHLVVELTQDKLSQNQKPWLLQGSSLTIERIDRTVVTACIEGATRKPGVRPDAD